uniref:DUS-like FMN-binding domain-containing protein n=1 Tax=Oryza glumipatula TaxID=40148 RepID=A0A0D9ZIC9_9ORYZ
MSSGGAASTVVLQDAFSTVGHRSGGQDTTRHTFSSSPAAARTLPKERRRQRRRRWRPPYAGERKSSARMAIAVRSAAAAAAVARHSLRPPLAAPGSIRGASLLPPQRARGVGPCRARARAASSSATGGGGHLPPLFSVAPMMDWTDNHYRTLARLISKHAWLYTEMVVAETIVHQKDNLDRFLAFPAEQHPIVLQIGGSNLDNLAKATELANAYSYDEINLNCGCPSGKVAGHGCFGARLMFDPEGMLCQLLLPIVMSQSALSAELVLMIVTPTKNFVNLYEYYFALLRDFPDVQFTLNGGITTIDQVTASIRQGAHRVMVGRAAYNNPWNMLGHVDSEVYGMLTRRSSRRQILESYQVYGDSIMGQYGPSRPNVRQLVKPLLNLFHSEPGNGLWKRKADSTLRHCKTLESFLEETLDAIPNSVLDAPIGKEAYIEEGHFADMDSLLPPRYSSLTNGSCEIPALVTAST